MSCCRAHHRVLVLPGRHSTLCGATADLCFGPVTWATMNSYRRNFIDELKNKLRKMVKSMRPSDKKIFERILKFDRRPQVFLEAAFKYLHVAI